MLRSTYKKINGLLSLLIFFAVQTCPAFAALQEPTGNFTQWLRVGSSGAPASTIALDITSTTKGVIFPRMTNTQRNAISSPATGTIIFSITDNSYEFYDGAAWSPMGGIAALTANRGVVTNGAGALIAATTTDTEIGYVSGVTSAIQTQLGLKAPLASPTFTGVVTAPSFVGALTGNASTVTTNANLTGPVTSVGNATTITATSVTSAMLAGSIAVNKLVALGTGIIPYTDGSGFLTTTNGPVYTSATQLETTTGDTTGNLMQSTTDTTSSASMRIDQSSKSLLLKTIESSTNTGYSIGLSTASIAGANANATGSVSLTTGDKTAGTGASGGISLTTGATTGGTRGRITLADGSEVNAPGSVWTISGNSGGGHWVNPSDSKNYIANPDANIQSSSAIPAGWANYFDAAGTAPVDCTGGSPVTALTRNTTTPIGPGTDFRWTKSATSRQGEGFSYDFSIEKTDQAKVMKIGFDYSVASGTFVAGSPNADSDMTIWIYDITNAVLIQPSTYKLFSSTTSPPAAFDSTFQSNSNSTSYRLCVHTGTTSANAYTLAFRNFEAKRARYTYGTSITDWVAYTPTFANLGSVTAINVKSRRVGDSLEIQGNFTTGTVGAGTASMTLGYNGVSGNVTTSSIVTAAGTVVGHMNLNNQSTVNFSGLSVIATPSVTTVGFGAETSTTNGYTQATGTNMGNTGTYSFFITGIPITGWSSTVQMSDSAPLTVVALRSTSQPTGTVNSSVNIATFLTPQSDTVGGYSSGTYTVKAQGSYNISAALEIDGTFTVGQNAIIYLYKNGSEIARASALAGGSVAALFPSLAVNGIDLIAGDALTIRTSTTAGGSPSYGGSNCFFSLVKAGDPRTTGATETTGVREGLTSNQTGVNPNGSAVKVLFNDVSTLPDFLRIGAWSSGTYTVPTPGLYSISSTITVLATNVLASVYLIRVYKNGSYFLSLGGSPGPVTAASQFVLGSTAAVAPFVAGDTIEIYLFGAGNNSASTLTIFGGNDATYASIVRVGN